MRLVASCFLVFFLLVSSTTVCGKEKSAGLSVEVEPGSVHTTQLGNLPAGASLSITLHTDGKVRLYLVDAEDFKRFPRFQSPLFSGRAEQEIDFQVETTRAGHHYLIVDNRRGDRSRNIKVQITASKDNEPHGNSSDQVQAVLQNFETQLRQYFIFKQLNFQVARCGRANAFTRNATVILCAEIAPTLLSLVHDKKKAEDALMFAIMHEIGHVLLKQWGYPFYDNEELADEFATALLLMFGQGERAHSQAEYFSQLSAEDELAQKLEQDDKHPLSVQRARNILGWLKEPDLVRRWQKLLVPNMQTRVLEALRKNPKTWTDQKLLTEELARRGG